jgi:hypothetical protein
MLWTLTVNMFIKAAFDEHAVSISMLVKDGTVLHDIHSCATTGRHVNRLNSQMLDTYLPGCTSKQHSAAVRSV